MSARNCDSKLYFNMSNSTSAEQKICIVRLAVGMAPRIIMHKDRLAKCTCSDGISRLAVYLQFSFKTISKFDRPAYYA